MFCILSAGFQTLAAVSLGRRDTTRLLRQRRRRLLTSRWAVSAVDVRLFRIRATVSAVYASGAFAPGVQDTGMRWGWHLKTVRVTARADIDGIAEKAFIIYDGVENPVN